ncbi:MAG: peptide MFS transporter [Eubacteriales bacterium]|nr:peptide MFS transporter [Eubacteriales bacterium]
METAKKGKPFGFYVCALGFTFERMAFYTVKYLLAIWLATNATSGGLGLTDSEGAALSANFVAWTYITPIIGGYIADHWISPRLCVQLGMLLMGVGYICAGMATDLKMVWVMIVLVAVGTGFFKGNLSGVNGLLFGSQEELDEAFSIQYSFVNIGSFVGTTFIAVLATSGKMSFTGVFTLCGCLLILDLIWFTVGGKASLGDAGKTPFKKDTREFVSEEKKAQDNAPLTSGDKKKVVAIVLLTLLSAVFWMLWYMAYMPAYYRFGYGDGDSFMNKANWYVGSFQIPTSWFDSVNALCCIILGPVLAIVWRKLSERPQGDMSMFRKTALGCILVGISYIVMVIADNIAGDSGQCSIFWLALVCILMSVGEMVFSPLGNSFISKFAPAKLLGFLLGFWPIAVFFAQKLYPKLYDFLNTMSFAKGYGVCAAVVIIFGVILWAFSNKLESWSTEEE